MADIQKTNQDSAIVNTMQDGSLPSNGDTKFCKHCGKKIPVAAVVCPACGCQVEELKSQTPNIVINNSNENTNMNTNVVGVGGRMLNKWVAFFLCLFLGFMGAHKFYEGKNIMGVVYLFTFGVFGIGWVIDIISLFFKPNPYYVT